MSPCQITRPFDQDAMNQDGLNTRSRLFDIREGKLYRKD